MDTLKDKKYVKFTYQSRYADIPIYYDTLRDRYVCGIGTNLNKTTYATMYKIQQGDTLDSLALQYYNNPTLWWVIAYFNSIIDAFTPLEPNTLIWIPALASIEFGAER